jgi:soluble lytic murein transglycosylase-like protein
MRRAAIFAIGSIGALAGVAWAAEQGAFGDAAQNVAEDTVSAIAGWKLPDRAAPYAAWIADASAQYGLPDGLLGRQLYQESRFRPEVIDGSVASPVGALGIAQFMPATAAELGIDPLNAQQSIYGMARYMAQLYAQLGDWKLALAAYNWGIGNVQRKGIDAAPAETVAYVNDIASAVGIA